MEVENSKGKQFHIKKCGRKRMHKVVKGAVKPHFLPMRKAFSQVQLVINRQVDFSEVT